MIHLRNIVGIFFFFFFFFLKTSAHCDVKLEFMIASNANGESISTSFF